MWAAIVLIALFRQVDGLSKILSRSHIRPRALRALAPAMALSQNLALLYVNVPSHDIVGSAAIFRAACNMETLRSDSFGCTFLGFGTDEFNLRVSPVGENSSTDDALEGISVSVANITVAMAAASAVNAEVIREINNVTFIASMHPDEDISSVQQWALRAVLRDPHSGLDIELLEHAPESIHRSLNTVNSVILRVLDLDAAINFYSKTLGMNYHRKRSLVPIEPATSAWLSYSPSELEGTHLELRYVYGRSFGRLKAKPPKRNTLLTFSAPDVPVVITELTSKDAEGQHCMVPAVLPPNLAASLTDASAAILKVPHPPEGLFIELVDELAYLKSTL
jgi:catechol 2,3-dioxygenase-like lactoylglutathione lyase family enzyme